MKKTKRFPKLQTGDDDAVVEQLTNAIKELYRSNGGRPIRILEAGCGARWAMRDDLTGVEYTLTGVDIYEQDLEIRKNKVKDLDEAIVGDLRTVELDADAFDIIYNSFVLEHVDGARRVLDNFQRWVKPGGKIILKIPDSDTCFGFYTRITPFWVHVFYKKYVEGNKNAGKPGFGPFPTYYDKVVSRKGIHEYCQAHGLSVDAEFALGGYLERKAVLAYMANSLVWLTQLVTLGRLAANHTGVAFVISRP
jgi:SAM-dependent methyltransferase